MSEEPDRSINLSRSNLTLSAKTELMINCLRTTTISIISVLVNLVSLLKSSIDEIQSLLIMLCENIHIK